nr:hypothetical protein [Tanacetum cinerariifolium]
MVDLPPPSYAANLPEDEPIHHEPAPIILDLAPIQPNGYLSNDDDEEEKVKEMDDDEMEVDDNGEEDGKDNVDDDVEVINPYEHLLALMKSLSLHLLLLLLLMLTLSRYLLLRNLIRQNE